MSRRLSERPAWRALALILLIAILTSLAPSPALAGYAALDSSQPSAGATCELYPLALHSHVLQGKAPGDTIELTRDNSRSSWAWLTWTGDQSAEALARSLTPPGDSGSYVNPVNPADRELGLGDYVRGRPGVVSSEAVRAALDLLRARDIVVPVWDATKGNGANVTYQVGQFARVRIVQFALGEQPAIALRLLGYEGCGFAPLAEPASATVDEDTSVNITLRATYRLAAPLTFTIGAASRGSVGSPSAQQCATADSVTTCTVTVAYTPDPNAHGDDQFVYTVSDGRLDSAPAIVSIAVRPVNDTPVAAGDVATTDEDAAVTIDLLANDSDIDGDGLAVSALGTPARGSATIIASGADAGKLRYTPAANASGADSFSYTLSDGAGGTAVGMVVLTITPINDAPALSAQPERLDADEDAAAQAITLSADDVETVPADLVVRFAELPAHGILTTADGRSIAPTDQFTGEALTVRYTPDRDFAGDDSLVVSVQDTGDGASPALGSSRTVAIGLRAVNDAPTASPAKLDDVRRGVASAVTLRGVDVDSAALSFEIVTPPANGSLGPVSAVQCAAAGAGAECTATVDYTADENFAGTDSFTYRAADGSLGSAPVTVTFAVTNAAPTAQAQNVSMDEDTGSAITLAGTDSDGDALTFAIVTPPAHGELSVSGAAVQYTPAANYNGADAFSFTVSDGLATSEPASVALTVRPVNDLPAFTAEPANTLQSLGEGEGLAALAASDPDGDALSFSLATGTLPTGVSLAANGTFAGTAQDGSAGSYIVEVAANDGNGGVALSLLTITVAAPALPLPPDPATVAPPMSGQTGTTLADATSFLYTGPNPIQQGVAPGAIDPQRAGVIRGVVRTRDGQPLGGVTVSVKDHPEYGHTLSRRDGAFDLAVNGGGLLTVEYEKSGFLRVQRQINLPWQEYGALPDVVLIPLDSAVTTVDLSAETPIQVARGNPVTDEDGTRQATLFFPQGTVAELLMPDGSKQPISTMHVRATEYTVGESGPLAMPGELPMASAYTYAAQLRVDEAYQVGAKSVLFSQTVPFYVENFLGFAVGVVVPVGYYDPDKAAWLGSDNGRVIGILSEANGVAVLDVDGSGSPASAAALAALGITDDERRQLAALYEPGQSLWRAPLSHFTDLDLNWAAAPPSDALKPNQQRQGGPQAKPEAQKPVDDEVLTCGSVIGCVNQTLGERAELVGTSFDLHYQSDRTYGYAAARTIDIPLSGANVPMSLDKIMLEVSVAGRVFMREFSNAPNQRYTFVWDGEDGYGRLLQGAQPVTVRVGYKYPVHYYQNRAEQRRAWARVAGAGVTQGPASSRTLVIWQEWKSTIGGWTARALGAEGWGLTNHHAYDRVSRTLLLGDGSRRTTDGVGTMLSVTVAGNGMIASRGDGGPATSASFRSRDIEVGPDGSLYIADVFGHRIRKVAPDGTISTVAGNGTQNFSGDGGPATSAQLSFPTGIAIGPDGSIYIADSSNSRIRKVTPDGIIRTVAGNGQFGSEGDEGPAVSAQLGRPEDVAVAPDGTIYIADTQTNLIRQVDVDGRITTLAGRCPGQCSSLGNDGPAILARLHAPRGLAIGPDGSLYIADTSNNMIRQIGADGIIRSVIGDGFAASQGDGGPATSARINSPEDIAVDSSGRLYVSDNQRVRLVENGIISTIAGTGVPCNNSTIDCANKVISTAARFTNVYGLAVAPNGMAYVADGDAYRVRKLEQLFPDATAGEVIISSSGGDEVYRFNVDGRHLQTIDALTGALRYSFAYDAQGRLSSVTDVDGRVTTIERDANDRPTAIVAPNSQRTTLAVNADGYLTSITNPANETYRATTAGGLLTSWTTPRTGASSFTYDPMGRLLADEGPDGTATRLVRSNVPNGFRMAVVTALGRTTTHTVERLPNGERRITTVRPDGARSVQLTRVDGSQQLLAADGTVFELGFGPDPRWGMAAPVTAQITRRTPGGLQSVATTTRTAQLTNPNNPFTLVATTQTTTINGRAMTSTYNAAQRTITTTTAGGRTAVTVLDARGRIVEERNPGVASITFSYDQRGRLTQLSQGGRTWISVYNDLDQLTALIDPMQRRVELAYDAAGRLTGQTQPDDSSVGYSHTAAGDIATVTPAGRAAHSFDYTPGGLLADATAPAVGDEPATTSYTYNRDRQPAVVARPDGQALGFEYGDGGRLQALQLGAETVNYSYGAQTGLRSGVSVAGGSLAFAYDGSLLTRATWNGAVAGSVGWAYNADLQVQQVQVNGANPVTFGYDADGLLTTAGALTLVRSAQTGRIASSTLGAVGTSYSYDSFGELASSGASFAGATNYAVTYTRDDVGRITGKIETIGGVATTYGFSYDELGQLTGVTRDGAVVASYAYDANGNRTEMSAGGATIAASFDAQDRLVQQGDSAYAYSLDGVLLRKTTGNQVTSYQYDVAGNLRGVSLPGGRQIGYVVDGQQRRIGRTVDGTLVQGFLYDGQLRPVAELDGSGAVVSRFVYGMSPNVPEYMVKGGTTYRIIGDERGSPRLVVNSATGEVAQRLDYDVWGQVTGDSNPGFQPFGFAGGLYDRDTGLVRFGMRDYDPATGRWTAKDPLGFAGGQANLYAYVGNDPVNTTDPTGLFNPGKGAAAVVNFANAGRLLVSGLGNTAAAIVTAETGLGVAYYGGTAVLNYMGAKTAFTRGVTLWNQALNEDASQASYRNMCGVLPFGDQYDEPGEPGPLQFWRNFSQKMEADPLGFVMELATLSG